MIFCVLHKKYYGFELRSKILLAIVILFIIIVSVVILFHPTLKSAATLILLLLWPWGFFLTVLSSLLFNATAGVLFSMDGDSLFQINKPNDATPIELFFISLILPFLLLISFFIFDSVCDPVSEVISKVIPRIIFKIVFGANFTIIIGASLTIIGLIIGRVIFFFRKKKNK